MNPSARLRTLTAAIALIGAIVAHGTPTVAAREPLAVPEHAAAPQRVGRLSPPPLFGQRLDAGPPRFEIIAGNSDEVFRLDPATGELFVARSGVLDFESRRRYELTIRVQSTAAGDAAQRTFAADLLASSGDFAALTELLADSAEFVAVIDILDVDEPPTVESQTLTLVYEAGDRRGATAFLKASDPESSTDLRYSVLAGDPEALLVLDKDTGRVDIVPDGLVPPGQHVLPLTVLVTDAAGNSDAATVLVRVVGLAEPVPAAPQVAQVVESESATAPLAETGAAGSGDDSRPAAPQDAEPPTAKLPTASAPVAAPVPAGGVARRDGNRAALWPFLCGVLLGAGGVALVANRRRREPDTKHQAPREAPLRDRLHQLRPQPLLFPPVAVPPHVPAAAPPTSTERPAAPTPIAPPACPPGLNVEPEVPVSQEHREDEPENRESREHIPVVAPQTVAELDVALDPTARQPIACPWLQPATTFTPELVPDEEPAEASRLIGEWPADEPVFASPIDDRPVDEATADSGGGEQWPAVEQVEHTPVAGDPVISDGAAEAAEGVGVLDVSEGERPEFEGATAETHGRATDASAELTPTGSDSGALPETTEAATDHSPDEAGDESRVLELRRQLTELFGVPADYQSPVPEGPVDEPDVVAESAAAAECHAASAPGVGADVVSLLDTWRARLNAELDSEAGAATSMADDVTADAFVLTPLTPETRLARSAAFELPPRVDKSAMRQELSSLRAVANTHARAVVARLSTEKRARQVWLISAIGMVPLFSGGTYVLTSMPPGPMRWLGWLMLTGGAAAFSVCLNSFNRLSRLHEEEETLLPDGSAGGDTLHDTAEIPIPPELAAEAPATPPARETAEQPLPSAHEEPEECEQLAATT